MGYRVDDLIVDAKRQHVARGNEQISLSPLSYDLLLALLHAAPDLVSLDELMKRVWPGVIVSPETVSQRVKLVRNALGDKAGSPRYIAGVRGRGYRLVAPVKAIGPAEAPGPDAAAAIEAAPPSINGTALPATSSVQPSGASTPQPPTRQRPRARRTFYAILGLLVAVVLVLGIRDESLQDWLPAQRVNSALEPGNSVAVLPFVDLTDEPGSELFTDGLSEEILNRLSGTDGLRVLARTSSFAYKGSSLDAHELRNRLGVRYLLEGSVRREDRHLRITAQLVDASGFRVWSESYDREATGIFAIQDEIAASVTKSILPQLSLVAEEEVHPDVVAYEHYLVGREILRQRRRNADVLAVKELERAIEIDPQFAEARAELGIALTLAGNWRSVDVLDRAQEEIDVALSLEPGLARAHAALGFLLLSRHVVQMQRLEGRRIEVALRAALALDPKMVDAHNWLAGALTEEWRYDEARAELEKAARVAPLAPAVNANLAVDFANQGDFAEAERRLRQLLDVPQPSIIAFASLEELYFGTGRLLQSNELAKGLAWAGVKTGRVSNELLVASYAHLGLWEMAEYWQRRIERERGDARLARNPRLELMRLQGRYAEAAAALEASSEPGRTGSTATDLELGTLHALAGDHVAAIRALEPASMGDFTPSDAGIEAGHSLAWAYLQTGAPERAEPILRGLEQFFLALRGDNRLHAGGLRYLFAQNAVLSGERDLAIARLRQAVEAGWRDYYRLLHDPRWQAVRDDRRFQALMATVEADIDRQRARLEQEEDNDFIARIDAAVAAQRTLPE